MEKNDVAGIPSTHAGECHEVILQTIRDGVYTLDDDGRITWVNDVVISEFDLGYTRNDLIGSHVELLLSEDDLAKCQSLIADLRTHEARESERCEIALQTKHGTEIPVELHLALLPAPDGEFRGTAGVVRDITHRNQQEQWLQVLNRVMRHNLRNQLLLIDGHIDLFKDDLPASADPYLQTIDQAIDHLIHLSQKTTQIQQALMDSDPTPEPIDATDLTTSVCCEFQRETTAAEISVETPSSAWVYADRSLGIVVENLLENAVEHSDRDSPSIDVTVRTTDVGTQEWVEIRVADDGPGIPPTELEAITSGEVTPLQHADGLGLWLVKWFVDRYGGDLEFADRTPRGSIVTVRLPGATPGQ